MTAHPVRTMAGYYVIRSDGRRTGPTPTFEESRLKLERDLRADAVREAIGGLLANIKFVKTPAAQ